jgi:hypothetical protein
MTIAGRPLTADRWIIAILAVGAVCGAWMRFVSLNPWPFILLGVLLLLLSFLPPRDSYSGQGVVVYQKGSGMEGTDVITKWDESKIKTAVHSTLVSQGSGAVRTLLSGILSRFVDNQNAQTFKERTAFINTQIEYVETWTKLQVVGREAARTERKEDLKDDEIQVKEKGLGHNLELIDLQHELEMEKLREQLAETRHRRSSIGKEPPAPPPPPPPPPSAREVREMRKVDLRARETEIRQEMLRTEADTYLTDEQRQRKMNALEDQLALVHEELAGLL